MNKFLFLLVSNRKGDRIYHQLKKLGSSLDWDRACFTMDTVSTMHKNPTQVLNDSQKFFLKSLSLLSFKVLLIDNGSSFLIL